MLCSELPTNAQGSDPLVLLRLRNVRLTVVLAAGPMLAWKEAAVHAMRDVFSNKDTENTETASTTGIGKQPSTI